MSDIIIKPCFLQMWQKHGSAFHCEFSDFVCSFPCSVEYLGNGKFRLWFAINEYPFNIGYAEGVPGNDMPIIMAKLSCGQAQDAMLSISNLPSGWAPTQPIKVALADGRDRLYFWAHSRDEGVVRFLAAESYDKRNYTVLDPYRPCLYHVNDRAAVESEYSVTLGLTPSIEQIKSRPTDEPIAPKELICNDATTLYKFDNDTWELFSAALIKVDEDDPRYVAHDNAAGWIRVIDRWESSDGLHWNNRKRVIEADSTDPVDQQFYHLAVFHTPQGRIGLLGNYRCQKQTMDVEWCFSEDGINWDRPCREGWIKRGSDGDSDCYGIYPTCDGIVQAEGKYWMFYTGVNFAHNGLNVRGSKAQSQIMYATIDLI